MNTNNTHTHTQARSHTRPYDPRALGGSQLRGGLLLVLSLVALFGLCGRALAAAPEEPVSEPASEITATTARLNGELAPHTEALTGYEFSYNTNGTCSEGLATTPGIEENVLAKKVSTPVSELEANREYTYCVIAIHTENEVPETTSGAPVSFKTLAEAPSVLAESTSAVTPFEGTLEGSLNANNEWTTYSFQYATKATGETLEATITTLPAQAPVTGGLAQPVSLPTKYMDIYIKVRFSR